MTPAGAIAASRPYDAELLAFGRERLERLCGRLRVRHLYPVGADPALLLMAWQELDRRRAVAKAGRSRRGDRRQLAAILAAYVKRDAVARDMRLLFDLPAARSESIRRLPAVVEEAVAALPEPQRVPMRAHLRDEAEAATPDVRAWRIFHDALVSSLLARPETIASLHPQIVARLASPQPLARRHPLATLLLIRLPLQLVLLVFSLLSVAYLGAYMFFNDAVLGAFVSGKVSGLLEGELEMKSIHWNGRLILDLLTGEPSYVVVEDITVYEPYKSYGGERRPTAHVERVEATLVLHEIIPWNRLAIPAMFEVPWMLHFDEVTIHGDSWFTVRGYRDEHDSRGEVALLGLRDAFQLVDQTPNDRRGLSFAVDHASLEHVDVDVDYRELSGWRFDAGFDAGEFGLRFVSIHPLGGMPRSLPFSFDLRTQGGGGELVIDDIWVPLANFDGVHMYAGTADADYGDVRFVAGADASGSRVDADGVLRYALTRMIDPATEPLPYGTAVVWGPAPVVELRAVTREAGGILAHTLAELELPESAADGTGAAVIARIEGPISEPVYHLAAEGLVLDPLDEPAWTVDDARLSVRLASEPAPERWAAYYEGPRLVATFDAFEGAVLDGGVRLRDGTVATVVLPANERDAMLLDADIDLIAINPAQLVPDDASLAATAAGSANGRLAVHELRLGPVAVADPRSDGTPAPDEFGMQFTRLEFDEVAIVRDRGPADDGVPRHLGVDGILTIDERGAMTWEDLRLTTDGATLATTGALDGSWSSMRSTSLQLDIDDGAAFSRAFGLPVLVDELRAQLDLSGPLSAPNGRDGKLMVRPHEGAVLGDTHTRLWVDRGVLHLAGDDVRVLGARGKLDVAVELFQRGQPTDDPRIRAYVDLQGVDLGALTGGEIEGMADVEVDVGDGDGKSARLSELRVGGTASVPTLRYGGTAYRGAEVAFRYADDELAIEQMVLPLHRRTAPSMGGASEIETGRIVADGTVRLQDDPELDLHVLARGVPLEVVARFVDAESPLRGQIGAGTEFDVGGTLSRPAVEGKITLVGLSAYGIALGSGALEIESDDAAAVGSLLAHREVWAKGELSTGERRGGRIDWSIDAVVAIGKRTKAGTTPPIAAQVDVGFDRIALPLVLRASGVDPEGLQGELEGLSAHVLTCNGRGAMLSDCVARQDPSGAQSLAVTLGMDRAWVRARSRSAVAQQQRAKASNPCTVAGTLCADGLQATVDGERLRLEQPLRLHSAEGTKAEIAGSFDLQTPPPAPPVVAAAACRAPPPPPPKPEGLAPDDTTAPGHATLRGTIALGALQAMLSPLGINTAKGSLEVDLAVDGPVQQPALAGRIDLRRGGESLWLQPSGVPTPLEFTEITLGITPQWLSARGTLEVYGESLQFGQVAGERTGVAFAGPCSGHFDLAAEGTLGVRLLAQLVGDAAAGAQGGIDVRQAVASGTLSPFTLERAEGTLGFFDHDLSLGAFAGLESVTLTGGEVELARCGGSHDCSAADIPDGAIALYVGARGAPAPSPGPKAIRAEFGSRGRASLWGRAYVDGTTFTPLHTELDVRLDDVAYRNYDARGRPVAEAEVSSPLLALRGTDPIVVKGDVELARARYVKDAIQGADILALTDSVELAEAPPPDFVRNLQFDLHVESDDPLRVENNIASGVEANADVVVSGTYDAPEFAGRIDFESGGRVDLPFLTGTYELQRGRVNLLGDIDEAEVDLLALRQEPIYVDAQPRQLQLLLAGTLAEIRWTCLTDGDTGAAQQTARSCFDYLVLGTGDVQVSEADVRRFGGGGLSEARKPLQVVGHVTELDLDERAAKAVPRARGYVPDMRLRLGQIGPELQVSTPRSWFDFDYGRLSFGWDYTRGYPGFFLRQSRQLTVRLELLEPITLEFSRRIRSYLNQRVVFDPLTQRTVELRFDVSVPSAK
ncbi:MAG: translocation/assembly module TamB domain-containing protein [Nannocystaceae bacterium]|nr:translocation/assembly module TamB domain-containing protein [Nannocystaceae bacterium]